MLRFEIPDVAWGTMFGILITVVLVGPTLQYFLPSPLETSVGTPTDCQQPAVNTQEKTKSGNSRAKDNTAILQNIQAADHENEPEGKKREYECLIAKYTGNLAAFTRWLVIATLLLAFFGFWQVMVSRNTAKRQLRAYIGVYVKRTPTIFVNTSPSAILSYKNFGQTPAREVRFWAKMIIAPHPSNPSFPPEPFREERLLINPGSDTEHIDVSLDGRLTDLGVTNIQMMWRDFMSMGKFDIATLSTKNGVPGLD